MPSKSKRRLKELTAQLEALTAVNEKKEVELQANQAAVAEARAHIDELENDNSLTVGLEETVQQLLTRQREATREYSDYENRVLSLELQSLVDRYRMMDVEHLESDNHNLREEVFRLQAENMQLSRAVSENSIRSRRDLARIEIAMEGTVRERLLSARKTMMEQLVSQLDVKTRLLLTNHGELQEAMISLADQVTILDDKYRTLSMQKRQFKVDSELGESMSKLQARQLVVLRHQLDHAFLVNSNQKAQLEKEEARAEKAEAEAVRANSMAYKLTRDIEKMRGFTGPDIRQGDDSDSAYGMAGEDLETEVASLNRQLSHVRSCQERVSQQRDNWRERCLLYEQACSQLQASLHALQGNAQLCLPDGKHQAMDSVWCKADGGKRTGVSMEVESSQVSQNSERSAYNQAHSGDATGGWLSGTAVRAQSARMRHETGAVAGGRPASVGMQRSTSDGRSSGSGMVGLGGAANRRPASAAVTQSARPFSAAVPEPVRPFSAVTPAVVTAQAASITQSAQGVSAQVASAAQSAQVVVPQRPMSAMLLSSAGGRSSSEAGGGASRPSSAVPGGGSNKRGQDWRMQRTNAAQVGWLSGKSMGARGVGRGVSSQSSEGGVQSVGSIYAPQGSRQVGNSQMQRRRPSTAPAQQAPVVSCRPMGNGIVSARMLSAGQRKGGDSGGQGIGQRMSGDGDGLQVGTVATVVEEGSVLEELGVEEDEGGEVSGEEDVQWDESKVRHQQQMQLQQLQQQLPAPITPYEQPQPQAVEAQQQQPDSSTVPAPSRLYSNEPEPFQAQYLLPPGAERVGLNSFQMRARSAAPVLSTAPNIQRKRPGSMRYFTEPTRTSQHSQLVQGSQEFLPLHKDPLGTQQAPPASPRQALSPPPAYRIMQQAAPRQGDPSVMFASPNSQSSQPRR